MKCITSIILACLIFNITLGQKINTFNGLQYAELMSNTLMSEFTNLWQNEGRTRPAWGYTQGLIALAFRELYEYSKNEKYFNYIKQYYDTIISENGKILNYKLSNYSLDDINAGKVLFYLYDKTGKEKFKITIDTLIKQLINHPKTVSGGYWHKLRYPNQLWLDGVYMAAPFIESGIIRQSGLTML